MTAVAFPKPVKRQRSPQKPIQRKTPLKAKRWGVSHGPSKTKHGRRERNFGHMAFIRSLPCGVPGAFFIVCGRGEYVGVPVPGPCRGHVQCMHLGWKADPGGRRRPGDTDTAPGCELHHAESGTKLGGLGKWYVALGRDGQRALRAELVSRATEAWNALREAGQAHWNEMAAATRRKRNG